MASRLLLPIWLTLVLAHPIRQRRESHSLLAAEDKDEYIGSDPDFLPSVKCVMVLALENSSTLAGLKEELKAMKLFDRMEVVTQSPDPQGKAAGCWNGHVKMWNMALDKGCTHTLILEEDARFEGPTLKSGMASAEKFLSADIPYDMYFLGWNADLFTGGHLPEKNKTTVEEVDGAECSYKVHYWFETHAYIISKKAMEKYKGITYTGTPIDNYLSLDVDVDSYVVKPKIAFQQLHTSQAVTQGDDGVATDGPAQIVSETPAIWYTYVEPAIWARTELEPPAQCMAPPAAYTSTPDLFPKASPEPLGPIIAGVMKDIYG